MNKLTIAVNSGISGDGFTTRVTKSGRLIYEKNWNYGYSCSCDRKFADERHPYVGDVLQGIIDKYQVNKFSVDVGRNVFRGTDESMERVADFKHRHCSDLKVKPYLNKEALRFSLNAARSECENMLGTLSDRELLETVRTHFESHPKQYGGKELRDFANEMLEKEDIHLTDEKRGDAIRQCAYFRIQEAKFESTKRVQYSMSSLHQGKIAMERIDSFDSTVPVSVYKMNANLVNGDDGFVFVDVEAANGVDFRNSDTPYGGTIGVLSHNFIANNPMNVEECQAIVQIIDYSNGQMKNISASIIVDTDLMSGDAIDLNNDMLAGLNPSEQLAQ